MDLVALDQNLRTFDSGNVPLAGDTCGDARLQELHVLGVSHQKYLNLMTNRSDIDSEKRQSIDQRHFLVA